MPPITYFADLSPWQRRTLCGLRWRLAGSGRTPAASDPLLDAFVEDLRRDPCRPIHCGALPDATISPDERLILGALTASRCGRPAELRGLLSHLLKPSAVRSAAYRLLSIGGPRVLPG